MDLFRNLDIETISSCNRTCPTCIRNSHPDRDAVSSWFRKEYLPKSVVEKALNEAVDIGFRGVVCLSHFNEPTMDERLPEFVKMARSHPEFSMVYFHTNGDYLDKEMASKFDGVADRIIVTLYMDEPIKSKRAEWIYSLFHKTEIQIIIDSKHIPSHWSPAYDVNKMISENIDHDCKEPATRVIINHRRQFLLCCEDLIGNFGFGTFPETSIKDYWFGEKHTQIHDRLLQTGGRRDFSLCSICPKT